MKESFYVLEYSCSNLLSTASTTTVLSLDREKDSQAQYREMKNTTKPKHSGDL